ncbi:UDP-N-acetylglucosamine 2-epimerase [Seongchinamella sediminis]|nr:UDP-N-acetylglucosamine 2-epimerase [Seongchinamella sediminis]
MAPVMVELQNRNIPYNFIFSGQHQATVNNIREEFGIKEPDITLYKGRDITGIVQMLFWSIRIVFFTLWNRDKVWQGDKGGVVLNHGDTFSTLLGALLARLSGQKSAHVESGLRSFRLFHPFPEEITRLLTFRLSNIYFAPGDWALANLEQYSGDKVNTAHNTLLDALRISQRAVNAAEIEIPDGDYGVVSLHRFENIFSEKKLREILALLAEVSKRGKLLFILHKPTENKLKEYGLLANLETIDNIELRPRYSYFQFIKLVKQALFVITDGGSNQEECFYLGKPCIIMRAASERQEGIGANSVICNYDREIINDTLDRLPDFTTGQMIFDHHSPSAVIVSALAQYHGREAGTPA